MTAKLTITDVERIVVDVPYTPRCQEWNAREIWQWRISEVIRVTTDAGIVGYGETILHYTWGRVPDEAIDRVKGHNPADFLGDDSLGAGLQMALYDVVGKALGVPVYRLLNLPRVREWCPISWWNIDMPPEAFAAEAQEALARGYTSHKIKARPWWDVYEQVEAISAVTPPHFRIDMDWNQMLINAGNAAPVLTELDKHERVAIYESPIMQRDVEGLRQLRAKTTRPIALHFGNPPFPTVVRDEACDGFVIGGGVARVLEQGTLGRRVRQALLAADGRHRPDHGAFAAPGRRAPRRPVALGQLPEHLQRRPAGRAADHPGRIRARARRPWPGHRGRRGRPDPIQDGAALRAAQAALAALGPLARRARAALCRHPPMLDRRALGQHPRPGARRDTAGAPGRRLAGMGRAVRAGRRRPGASTGRRSTRKHR